MGGRDGAAQSTRMINRGGAGGQSAEATTGGSDQNLDEAFEVPTGVHASVPFRPGGQLPPSMQGPVAIPKGSNGPVIGNEPMRSSAAASSSASEAFEELRRKV